jgi:hypothetical protein
LSSRSWLGALTCGGACGCSGESSLLGAVEKATAETEKHGDRSEKLSALVAEARTMLEQAKAEQAERARAAAAVKAAAKAEAAAERLREEEEVAALALRMQTRRAEGAADALRMQQMQAQLGSSVAPPAAPEETQCVVCMDAPKNRVVLPCMHLCACGPCAQRLLELDASCPVCRGPVERMAQVFS